MEYEPKTIPEGINTSKEHPLREFMILVSGITAVIIIIVSLLAFSTDYLMQFIPVEKENEWFTEQTINQFDLEAKQDKSNQESAALKKSRAEIEDYLQSLIAQLRHEQRPEYHFSVRLLDNETPNAFVAPGGHIFVTRGLLQSVDSENGLAMVLAHEMGHQYHRHPLRAMGRGIVISLALLVISGSETGSLAQSFISNAATLTSLTFNRDQEREADTEGVVRLQQLYGHSGGASEFFEAIQNNPDLESDMPVFMSTHPGVEERITYLREQSVGQKYKLTPLPDIIQSYLLLDR